MPDRILRAGILTSDTVCRLSWPAEVFYRRLMSIVDDYGRYDARPAILRAQLYPLQLDKVAESDVGKWMRETAEAGLVRFYSVNGHNYLEISKFDQRLRAAKSKWPSSADICQHLLSNAAESDTESDTESESINMRRAVRSAFELEAERVYQLYPRKVGKPKALKAIIKAIAKYGIEPIESKTREYAQIHGAADDYTPHPSTWFTQERFNDDPSTWRKRTQQKEKHGNDTRDHSAGF